MSPSLTVYLVDYYGVANITDFSSSVAVAVMPVHPPPLLSFFSCSHPISPSLPLKNKLSPYPWYHPPRAIPAEGVATSDTSAAPPPSLPKRAKCLSTRSLRIAIQGAT